MKYPPKHHQEQNFEHIIQTIQQFPLATLISAHQDEIFTTHLPLMYKTEGKNLGSLVGHIDKFNPHATLLQNDRTVQIIFHGPDCYISPKIYSTTQLPTWNYIKVHLSATASRINAPEKIIGSIAEMTSFLETDEHPYVLDEKSPKVQSLVDYIVGFKLKITSWEGKFKLSQDKLPKDRQLAKEALIEKNQKDMTDFMNQIL